MTADRPPPQHQDEWDEAARRFHRELLTNAQATAKVWAEGVTALLGLFGTVALVTGTDQIGELGTGAAYLVVFLISVAGLLAAAALYKLTRAQALPRIDAKQWNGTAYRAYITRSAQTVARQVNAGRILGALAGALIFLSGIVALVDGLP